MSVNYVKAIVGGFFGMQITNEVIIEGHAANPEKSSEIITEGLEKVKAAAQKLVGVTA